MHIEKKSHEKSNTMKNMRTHITKSNQFFKSDSSIRIFFKDINSFPLLDKATEDKLAKKGDIDTLINCNLRYAVRLAHAYDYQGNLEDLIQCACIGMTNAAKAYNPDKMDKNGRFIYFAKKYIFGEIMQFYTMSHSKNKEDIFLLKRIKKEIERYQAEYGYEPDSEYIATKLGMEEEKVENLLNDNLQIVSVDTYFDEDEHLTYGDMIAGDLDADLELVREDESRCLEMEMHAYLKPKEETVMRGLLAMDSSFPRTLDDMADELQLTPQRCGQLKDTAIEKLKNNRILKYA